MELAKFISVGCVFNCVWRDLFFLVWRVDLAPNAGGLGVAELARGWSFFYTVCKNYGHFSSRGELLFAFSKTF